MSNFTQLHMLTCYAPSNLNRDDLGRPKTAKMGGVDRFRISSQSLKRAWRTSDLFYQSLKCGRYVVFDGVERPERISVRSRKFGSEWFAKEFEKNGLEEPAVGEWSIDLLTALGDVKKEKGKLTNELSQVVTLSPVELKKLESIVHTLSKTLLGMADDVQCREITELQRNARAENKSDAKKKKYEQFGRRIRELVLTNEETAVDVALFGRMLASSPKFNVEAAAQVAHAVTVNRIVVEDDYFTAVDDLNIREEDTGSAHIGEMGFGSGVFYSYVCINRTLLLKNLSGNEELAGRAMRALAEAAAQISPTGKQNSYGSRARALYVLAEKGSQQPRQLSAAFLKPVDDEDMAAAAIDRLETLRDNMNKVYGECADSTYSVNVIAPNGNTFEGLLDFVAG